ncbi:MAG: segregation and condensation protein A [Planctomycetaceae bacterium]
MGFQVDTEIFAGPMDLLVHLVRRHEVDVREVPIARVAEAFVAHLEVLEQLALDEVGEFVELASVLLEIKARSLLPSEEGDEPLPDEPREDLVQRLLEYRQYHDAAMLLEERARQWEQRFARQASPVEPPATRSEVAIADVHVWDLVGALGRVMKRREKASPRTISHDDTPIETHADRIRRLVLERGGMPFSELFEPGMSRVRMVGIFLAVLELVRRGTIAARQEQLFGEIWLAPLVRPADDSATVSP